MHAGAAFTGTGLGCKAEFVGTGRSDCWISSSFHKGREGCNAHKLPLIKDQRAKAFLIVAGKPL